MLNIALTPSQKPFHLAASLESLLNEINRVLTHEMSFSPWLRELISFERNHHSEHSFPPPRCRFFHASPCSLIYGSFHKWTNAARSESRMQRQARLLTYRRNQIGGNFLLDQAQLSNQLTSRRKLIVIKTN